MVADVRCDGGGVDLVEFDGASSCSEGDRWGGDRAGGVSSSERADVQRADGAGLCGDRDAACGHNKSSICHSQGSATPITDRECPDVAQRGGGPA